MAYPELKIILDGVCSVASELIRMDEWGIDVVMTASQKGLGAPPGLSILVASKRAIQVRSPHEVLAGQLLTVQADLREQGCTCVFLLCQLEEVGLEPRGCTQGLIFLHTRWLPIMKAYEQGAGAYFATPPVNLIYAFNASLTTITKSSEVSLEERFKLHQEASQRVKSAAKEFGLKQVSDPENAANGMTAVSSTPPDFWMSQTHPYLSSSTSRRDTPLRIFSPGSPQKG